MNNDKMHEISELAKRLLVEYYSNGVVDELLDLLDDDVVLLGAGRNQRARGKQDVGDFFKRSSKKILHFKLDNLELQNKELSDKLCLCEAVFDLITKVDAIKPVLMHQRCTFIFKRTDGRLMVEYIHNSTPYSALQGEEMCSNTLLTTLKDLFVAIYEADLYDDSFYMWKSRGVVMYTIDKRYGMRNKIVQIRDEYIHPEHKQLFWEKFNIDNVINEFENGTTRIFEELKFLLYNGEYRWVSCEVKLLEKSETTFRIMFYLRDIHENKQSDETDKNNMHWSAMLNEDANKVTLARCVDEERQKEANDAKFDFLAKMSHDLRTPMNAIIGMTAIAEECINDTYKVADCLGKIKSSSKYLLTMINDILDLSKIESGKVQVEKKLFSVREMLYAINEGFSLQVREKFQEFKLKVESDINQLYIGDSVRLRQVIENLLNNAYKYTDIGGEISLEVKRVPLENGQMALSFIVSDNGYGISPQFMEKLFDAFEQDSISNVRDGVGLGLAITKSIVRLMGGHITVRSKLGAGSVFTATIPFDEQVKRECELNKHMRVLIAGKCQEIKECCEKFGLEGSTAADYKEVAVKLKDSIKDKQQFDIVFINYDVFGSESHRIAEGVKKITNNNIYVLLVSDSGCFTDEYSYRKSGVDFFVIKPVDMIKLKLVLCQIENTSKVDKIKEIEKNANIFDGKRVLLVEDNEYNIDVAKCYLEMRGFCVETAKNGAIAVEMFKNSSANYYDVILMDIRMPVMNGYEATKNIRQLERPEAKSIPIYAMTADSFASDIENAFASGMNGHISKPIDFKLLLETLKKAF